MSKLLNKPFKAFTIYALVILALSIPAYYKVVDYIWLNELDEQNEIIKTNIEAGLQQYKVDDADLDRIIALWSKIQPWTKITSVANPPTNRQDSTYAVIRENKLDSDDEVDRFRGLSSWIEVNGKHYHLHIETNVEEADETIVAIANVTFAFFTLLILGFIFLNRRIAKGIWKPFRQTLEKLKSFDLASGKTPSFESTDIEEFEELHQVLQRLIDKNIAIYNQQKVFIENASHELQTPLAILKSKMDLFLQSKDVTQEQAEILNAIELPLARVSRINKNLLLLAKIENSQFQDVGPLDVVAIVHESMELLADYIEDKQLQLTVQISQPLWITCNKFLLETLVHNLLTNAIRHAPPQGSIWMELTDKTLYFRNTGLEALDKTRLFERFSASSPGTVNSGLGLAIVKEVCNRYGWGISYAFEDKLHAFAVTF